MSRVFDPVTMRWSDGQDAESTVTEDATMAERIYAAYHFYRQRRASAHACDCGAVKARTTHALWCSTQGKGDS